MTITTNDAIFMYGTQDKVSGTTSAVTDGSKSVAGDMDDWTNDDDAPIGTYVLECTFATQATVRAVVHLFALLRDVQSTNDTDPIDANFDGTYIGSFIVNDGTAAQYLALVDAPIPSNHTSQVIEFYIQNEAGQTMSAGWDLWVTPKTYGPHA